MNSNKSILVNIPLKVPLTIHLFITNDCNLNCDKCYYRNKNSDIKYLDFNIIKNLFLEWKDNGVKSVAIGGGEPLLHKNIEDIVELGKELGFFMSITTNGTIRKNVRPNRLHISFDRLHPTFNNIKLVQDTINFYRNKVGVDKIGINHVVSSLEDLERVKGLKNIDNIVLLKEKPVDNFKDWYKIKSINKYWLDACLCNVLKFVRCNQGITSMHIDYNLEASICSNYPEKIKYTNIVDTFKKIRKMKCNIRGF